MPQITGKVKKILMMQVGPWAFLVFSLIPWLVVANLLSYFRMSQDNGWIGLAAFLEISGIVLAFATAAWTVLGLIFWYVRLVMVIFGLDWIGEKPKWTALGAFGVSLVTFLLSLVVVVAVLHWWPLAFNWDSDRVPMPSDYIHLGIVIIGKVIGVLSGVVMVVSGVVALWSHRQTALAKALAVVTGVVLAIVMAVLIWWRIHARTAAMENACIYNLECIDGAKIQWALAMQPNLPSNAMPTWDDLAPYLENASVFWWRGGFSMPRSPLGATYSIRRVGNSPTCSYSRHTFALYGLMIHAGDVSIDSGNGEVFEIYEVPKGPHRQPGDRLRLIGSIVGATVEVLDETGHWTKVETGEDGTATLDTFSKKPVAIVVSKDGFLTSSNSVLDPYRYDYDILLQRKAE